jgi:type I restriction enzyme S subunit
VLTRQTAKLDELIKRAHDVIALFREYRGQLIADVTTGKVDVREVAARLPDETDTEELATAQEIEEPIEDQEERSIAGTEGESDEAVDAG